MPDIFDAKLLPCPFCGGAAEFEYTPWDEGTETGDDGSGWIECKSCHVQMTGYCRDDAEQRWNKRNGVDHDAGSETEGCTGKNNVEEMNSPNAKVSGAGTASAGLPGWQSNGETE